MERNLQFILAVNRFPGHRGWLKRRLLDECRDETDLLHASKLYRARQPESRRSKKIDVSRLLGEAEVEIRRLNRWNIRCNVLGDADYPANLTMIDDPPFVLYCRGGILQTDKPPIAIVGTRRPAAAGLRESYKLALEFALAGYPVVSGLAFGIDRAAHEGALDGGGKTWAVLAGGLDRPSPVSHRRLAASILDKGGVLLGEIAPGGFPAKYAFPRRNRILSGLCRGCVIVQAPGRSGALITADFALEQGRDLYVGSSGLSGLYSEGTGNLERQGAPVVSGAADVLTDWGRLMDIRRIQPLPAPQSPSDLVRLLRSELNGRMFRHTGGWFEYRGA